MATNSAQEAFFASAIGKYLDPDGVYRFQCVDVAIAYAKAIFPSVPWEKTFGRGNANMHFPKTNAYFDSITEVPGDVSSIPQRGDIIIWAGDSFNPYGHIAVVLSADAYSMKVIQQNADGSGNQPAHVATLGYTQAGTGRSVGWLRPKLGIEAPAAPVAPNTNSLNGIDISGWQRGINLSAVAPSFAIIKATGGTGFVNPALFEQYNGAKSAGILKGLYHFAHERGYQGSAVDEANHFLRTIRDLIDGETILVLDWEGDNVHDTGWAKTFADTVLAATGIKVLFYMNLSASNSHNWSAVQAAGYSLWLAQYPSNAKQGYGPLASMGNARGWNVVMWQYSQTGRLGGYNGDLDLNVFYGERNAWKSIAGGKSIVPSVPASITPSLSSSTGSYTVKSGDSLWAIGVAHGTTWQAIAAANGISDPNRINAGQVLTIPGSTAAAPNTSGGTYTVLPGDTLGAIATRYGVTVGSIASANGISNPNVINAGVTLTIPGAVSASSDLYTVKPGDNLSAIAAKYGVTWQSLAATNGISNPNLIQAGQTLRIGNGVPPAAPAEKYYTVRGGDNLSAIAAKYGTSWQSLASMNGISNPDLIQPGQKLRVG
jgi:LysM repeat protein